MLRRWVTIVFLYYGISSLTSVLLVVAGHIDPYLITDQRNLLIKGQSISCCQLAFRQLIYL